MSMGRQFVPHSTNHALVISSLVMCSVSSGESVCGACPHIHADVEQLNQLQKEKAAEPQTTRQARRSRNSLV